jgi:imidazolonepropionase-like amidohydrolase
VFGSIKEVHMRKRFPTSTVYLALVIGLVLSRSAQAQQEGIIAQPTLALTRCNVVNVRTGEVLMNGTVVLREGKIVSVDKNRPPSGMEVMDLEGRYVLPGLIDAHTHLSTIRQATRALHSGVTTVRSASVGSFRDVSLRDHVKKGYLPGPDMIAAGLFVTPSLGEAMLSDLRLGRLSGGVNTPEELRELVRIILDHGVDVIKTRGTERAGLPDTDPRKQVYTESQLRAVVEEAAKKGIPVMCHAHGDAGAMAAVKAGVLSIEHGTYMSDATLNLMKQKGTFLVPTYSIVIDLSEPGGDYDNPVLRIRGSHMQTSLQETIRRAYKMGIKIVASTDTSYDPGSLVRVSHEIVNFVGLGLSPLHSIQSATTVAAELLQIADRTGAVESGMEADIIAVNGNPLENIKLIEDILLVISNGRIALNRLPFAIN